MTGLETTPQAQRMKAKEARELVRRIRSSLRDCRLWLLDLYQREGWRALGYCSWRECVQVELEVSVRHCWRLLLAAQVELDVTHGSLPTGERGIPERQLRELARLDTAEERRAVYAEAASDGEASAARIREIVDTHKGQFEREQLRNVNDPQDATSPAPSPLEASHRVAAPGYWRVATTGKIIACRAGDSVNGRIVTVRPGDVLHLERE